MFLINKDLISFNTMGLGCRIKANYLHVGPGPTGECPLCVGGRGLSKGSHGSQYLNEFQRKPQKTLNS